MKGTQKALAGIVLLALYRALTALAALLILTALLNLLARYPRAVAGGSGDPGAEYNSPEPYVTFDVSWELPAQGPNVSVAPPAGLKNETGLGNTSWPLMEQSELMILLKEALPEMESKLVDEEAPQESQKAEPEGNREALQPRGVLQRFGGAEDTKTDPSSVKGLANTGRADKRNCWSGFLKVFLMCVIYFLMVLLLFKVVPAWATDIERRLTALRANSELLDCERGHRHFVI